MKMYWATIWSKDLNKDDTDDLQKSIFATIEENQYKALLKVADFFHNEYWLGKTDAIIEIKCEVVDNSTPDHFRFIKLIP